MPKFEKSKEFLKRSLSVTPIGAQTYSKSHRYLSGDCVPYFMECGRGGRVWDVDGNEFIDFILGLGPVTVGYNNPEINEVVKEQLAKGIIFSQSTVLEIELSEKLVDIIPCAEMVRFVKNGGDATSAAVRLARAATGREIIAACGYHGMHDWYIGSTSLNEGVPQAVCDLTQCFEYNNITSLEKVFAENRGKVAAVILEPVQDCGPVDDFLGKIKQLCEKNDTVLIFDEVVSGFRIALGGAQEYYGVVPDMAAIGKGMANGMPLSAVVGKKELLDQISEGVFISTTFGGEALSLAAALKTIEILARPDSFKHIWRLSTKLTEKSVELAAKKGLGEIISMWGLSPHGGFIFKNKGALTSTELLSVYQQRLLKEGILSLGINNFCLEHTEDDIERHLQAVDKALDDVCAVIEDSSITNIMRGPGITPIFKRN